MADYRALFEGKKITLLGLGVLGRGVGDAEFLAQLGAEVTVTDKKTEAELADSVKKLSMYSNIAFHLGGHNEKDFTDVDMVIKAAGVPLDSPYVDAAKAASVSVYMSTALFALHAMDVGTTVIGVTGTRGKTTITYLVNRTLAHAGRRTHLGGNIRGVSTLALMPRIEKGDFAVLELDSWQLQGFGDLQISPNIAVFSTFMRDHQNYYPSMDAYFADKANIFKFQKPGDHLIVGESVLERVRAAQPPREPVVPPPFPAAWKLQIPGEHNRENAALAIAALRAAGLFDDEIRPGIETFQGVEGRLQFVREIKGVKIYNDNNATTPEATIAALRAFDTKKRNVILITGGADKGLDISDLVSLMQLTCKKIILLQGTGTKLFEKEFRTAPVFDSLKPAIDAAFAAAHPGDIILFSPAFASFGMFKNEYDRNDQFLQIIRSMEGAA